MTNICLIQGVWTPQRMLFFFNSARLQCLRKEAFMSKWFIPEFFLWYIIYVCINIKTWRHVMPCPFLLGLAWSTDWFLQEIQWLEEIPSEKRTIEPAGGAFPWRDPTYSWMVYNQKKTIHSWMIAGVARLDLGNLRKNLWHRKKSSDPMVDFLEINNV